MARHTGNAPTASLKVACVQIRASTGCVRAPLDTVPLRKRNGTSRRGRPWRLFACGQICVVLFRGAQLDEKWFFFRIPAYPVNGAPLLSQSTTFVSACVSQKSSLPQAANSISEVLIPDRDEMEKGRPLSASSKSFLTSGFFGFRCLQPNNQTIRHTSTDTGHDLGS